MMAPAQASAWATRTGYIPISKGAIADLEKSGYYAAHPNDRVALDQLAYATPWPWAKNLFRVQREAVQPRLEEAVLGQKSARTMLEEARKAASAP
ncbi:MAG: ABC transporter substrate-binding protein, partial [Byssovorax sp.]